MNRGAGRYTSVASLHFNVGAKHIEVSLTFKGIYEATIHCTGELACYPIEVVLLVLVCCQCLLVYYTLAQTNHGGSSSGVSAAPAPAAACAAAAAAAPPFTHLPQNRLTLCPLGTN